MERQKEVICALSNDDFISDLDGRLTRFHGILKVEYLKIQRLLVLGTKLLSNTNRKL